jgi:hypothetical protein
MPDGRTFHNNHNKQGRTMNTSYQPGNWLRAFLLAAICLCLAACVTINTQPQSVTVMSGQTATFSVAATSDQSGSTISYQWYRNGSAISGATQASYSLTASLADNGATFYVVVDDSSNKPVQSDTATLTVTGSLSLLAGSAGGPGSFDGLGTAARFYSPTGVAVSSSGLVFVADYQNDTIRKIDSAGTVTTIAGSPGSPGSADGTGAAARFNGPVGITLDNSGNLYVTDNVSTIRKITQAGVVTTLAGSAASTGSTDGSAARFSGPRAIAADATGNLYVADTGNNTIRKVTPAGVVTTLAGSAGTAGNVDGSGAAARFNAPMGIGVDPTTGNLYVSTNTDGTVRMVTPAGVVTTLTPTGTLNHPQGLTVASNGTIYLADSGANLVRVISPAGVVGVLAGSGQAGAADGVVDGASFNNPVGIAYNPNNGYVVVADDNNHLIRQVSPFGSASTVAGTAAVTGNTGSAWFGATLFGSPALGLAADSSGTVYVADTANNAIRAISPGGSMTVAAAGLNRPVAIAASGSTLYAADSDGIKKIVSGSATLLAAVSGRGIAVDASGNVYVADTSHDLIRKVSPSGVVSTLAGQNGVAGTTNGTGSAATFYLPTGIAVDSGGNVYVAETSGDIRKITSAGAVTTFVSGIATPQQLAIDAGGTLYATVSGSAPGINTVPFDAAGFTSNANHLVLRISSAGVSSTLTGNSNGLIGIGTGSQSALVNPQGIAVLPGGKFAVATWDAVMLVQ